MQPSKLILAVLATGAVATPVGIALAADAPASPGLPASLPAPFAGHATLAGQLQARARALRVLAARKRARARRKAIPIPPILYRIAQCESHGDPKAIGGGGAYRGRYQFAISTWHSVGGRGDPIDASGAEQDRRAAMLLARSGPSQWPVCSR